jgi:GDPmannose 4,6-dehydratase
VTPYGVAKAYGHLIVRSYRRRYGMYACSGILFNHESPRRPPHFVPRKVSLAAARIAAGLQQTVVLGDLEAARDWGWAEDYVRAMWLMLQQDEPDDYVVASGTAHTVRELVQTAFAHVGLDYRDHVQVDQTLVRGRSELHDLVGDPSRAAAQLGWRPTVSFGDLVARLVDADVAGLAERRDTAGDLAHG